MGPVADIGRLHLAITHHISSAELVLLLHYCSIIVHASVRMPLYVQYVTILSYRG